MPGSFKIIATAYVPTTGSKGFGGAGFTEITGPLSGFFNTTTALVSGTDYYISDNYLSAFIAYPSEVANSITYLDFTGIQGGYTRPVNWVDFSLLSGLQVINASFTQGARLSTINLFAHPSLQQITTNEHMFTDIDVRNCRKFTNAFVRINRNPGLRVLDFAGVSALNNLSIETCQFSAFDVYGGPEYATPQLVVYARDNPYVVKDFTRCNKQTLTGIKEFYFSRFNNFSGSTYKQKDWNFSALSSVQILNLDLNLFTSIEPQLMPARDTLRTFICSNNSLTSVSFNSQSQLNYLDISSNTSALLSSINITPLPSLTYLNCNNVFGLSSIFGLEAHTWDQPVQESRVFQIDAANPASYPGSGTTIYNLRSLPNAATIALQFNPSNAFGGALQILNSTAGGNINYSTSTWQQLGLNNNFTVNMWLRLSSYPTESLRALFSTENYLQSGFRAFIGGSGFGPFPGNDGKLCFWSTESINSSVDGPGFDISTPTKIPLNTPVNFTFTVSPNGVGPLGVDAKVYVNGTLQVSTSGNFRAPWNSNISLFGIGGYNPAACELFLVEYMAGAQQQWQIGNRYNEYASRFGASRVVDIDTLLIGNTKLSALDLTQFSSLSSINFTALSNLRRLNLPDPCKLTSFELDGAQLTTLNLSSLANANTLYISNNANLSSLELQGLTGVTTFSTSFNNISSLDITPLSGLVNLQIIEPTLTSLTKENSYTNLTDVALYLNHLPQVYFNNNINLRTFLISENYGPVVELNNNIQLQTVSIYNDAAITDFSINNNPSFGTFNYSALTPVLSGLTFTNCTSVSSVSISNASIISDAFLTNLTNIKTLYVASCNLLSSIPNMSNNSSLSSLTINGCPGINNFDAFNCPALTVAELFSQPVSSIDAFTNNNNSLRSLRANFNYGLSTFRANLSATNNLLRLDLNDNSLSNDSIDYLLISLDARPSVPPGTSTTNKRVFYSNNRISSRSTFSNAAYDSLFAKGWRFTPAQSSAALQFAPTPTITITLASSALQFTKTATLLATATYLTSSIRTFFQVLSGPGALVNSSTLSALSGTGTVTMLVSSLSSNLFQPATATFDIQLQKLDASSNIVFSGLNKVYTGNAITASASVINYPEIIPTITYVQNNSATPPPVAAGYYTVSASIDSSDNIIGSSTAVLSVLQLDEFYTLPASATSSFIYFPKNCDTTKDIVVTFDYAFYGQAEQGEEGFCVTFTDTSTYKVPITGGGPGKALNYTNLTLLTAVDDTFVTKSFAGRFKGWLGVGFDVSGNFALTGIGLPGYANKVPNSICIRDSYLSAYNPLYRTESLASTAFKTPVTLYQSTTGIPEYTSVRVRLANLGKKVIVDMKPLSSVKYENYLQYDLPKSLPGITNVSLGYSSGKTTPTFKIKNFNLNYFDKEYIVSPYDLFTNYFNGPGEYGENGITYTSFFDYSIFYNAETPIGIPYSMDIFVRGIFLANVLFDPIYLNKDFAIQNDINGQATYSTFITGSNYL
jgi:hypothetical protein